MPGYVIRLQLGEGLEPLLEGSRNALLDQQIKEMRKALAKEHEIKVPTVNVSINDNLKYKEYVLYIHGQRTASGDLKGREDPAAIAMVLKEAILENKALIARKTEGQPAPKPVTTLDHIETIVRFSEESKTGEAASAEYRQTARRSLTFVAKKFGITETQALIFSHLVNRSNDNCIYPNELQAALCCSQIQMIRYLNDFEALEKKKLIAKGRDSNTRCYQVPSSVVDSLRLNRKVSVKTGKNLDIFHFFEELEKILQRVLDDEVSLNEYVASLRELIDNNMHLSLCKAFKSYRLDKESTALLSMFCEFMVNNDDDDIDFQDLARLFHERSLYHSVRQELQNQWGQLFSKGLIENAIGDGFLDQEEFTLTAKAKSELLGELDINLSNAKMKKGLVLAKDIGEKKMYYNAREEKLVAELVSLLKIKNFKSIQKRLAGRGMRTGFACLFYGKPGTGKTETVNQIARITGRDIMLVDIAQTKSCYFGESEKLIKGVFEKYKTYVKANPAAPILLFNEADAVIGKRKDVNLGNVAQTENAIQNIILQEMENLEGILIATTNLTKNFDPAFERRFLYKIEFEKPTLEARIAIWKSHIPELAAKDAETLANRFEFSGGQIENIARRRTVDSIIHGGAVNLDTLCEYCRDEKLDREQMLTIGFR